MIHTDLGKSIRITANKKELKEKMILKNLAFLVHHQPI